MFIKYMKYIYNIYDMNKYMECSSCLSLLFITAIIDKCRVRQKFKYVDDRSTILLLINNFINNNNFIGYFFEIFIGIDNTASFSPAMSVHRSCAGIVNPASLADPCIYLVYTRTVVIVREFIVLAWRNDVR